MGSASAKWAIMAPVFVPMLMRLGYSPEFTQLAYRVGDSSTNIITPLMSYFAMIVAFTQNMIKMQESELYFNNASLLYLLLNWMDNIL